MADDTTWGVCQVLLANQLVSKVKTKPNCGYHCESSLKIFLKQDKFLQFIKTSFENLQKSVIFTMKAKTENCVASVVGLNERSAVFFHPSAMYFLPPSLDWKTDFWWFFVVNCTVIVSISDCACQVSLSLDNLKLKLQLDVEIFLCAILLVQ